MQRTAPTSGLFARVWAFLTAPFRSKDLRQVATLSARADAAGEDSRALLKTADDLRAAGEIGLAVRTYWRAVHVLRRHDEYLKSVAVLKRIVDLTPHDGAAHEALAEGYEILDRKSEAAYELRRAAILAHEGGRANAARTLYDRAEALCPLSAGPLKLKLAAIKKPAAPAPAPAPAPARRTATPVPRAATPAPALPNIDQWPSIPQQLTTDLAPQEIDAVLEELEPIDEAPEDSEPVLVVPADITSSVAIEQHEAADEAAAIAEFERVMDARDDAESFIAHQMVVSERIEAERIEEERVIAEQVEAVRAGRPRAVEIDEDQVVFSTPIPATATEMALDVESFLLAGDPTAAPTASQRPHSPLAPEPEIVDASEERPSWEQVDTESYSAGTLDDLIGDELPTVTIGFDDPLRRAS